MPVFRSIVFSAALAGLIVGAVISVAQFLGTVPLIQKSEVYERKAAAEAPPAAHEHAGATHHHDNAGSNDSEYNVVVPFEHFLSDNNIPHEWHEYQGWHDEKYWSAHVKEYLIWYAQNWK